MRQRAKLVERGAVGAGAGASSRRAPRRAALRGPTPLASPLRTSAARSDRVRPPPPASVQASRRSVAGSGGPLRVLVVEDDAIIAMELEMTLEELGVEVVGIAMTAAEALRLAEIHRPDCATMDISIGGDRDGVSAAIQIYETLGIRSIFVSAYGNDETRARAAPARPVHWVRKPFDIAELRSALDRVANED